MTAATRARKRAATLDEQRRAIWREKRRDNAAARAVQFSPEELELARITRTLYMRAHRLAGAATAEKEARRQDSEWRGAEIRRVCGISLQPGSSWSHMVQQWKFFPYWRENEMAARGAGTE